MAKNDDKKPGPFDDSMTPEEKLFRVISGGRPEDSSEEELQVQDLLEDGFFSKIEGWIRKRKDQLRKGFQESAKFLGGNLEGLTQHSDTRFRYWTEAIRIESINKGLSAVIIALLIYLFVDMIFLGRSKPYVSVPESSVSVPGIEALKNSKISGGFLEHYQNQAGMRNVFVPPAPPPAVSPAAAETAQNPVPYAAPQSPAHIKLVGISWDADEHVAMLELNETEGTIFARKGDTLSGGINIIDIKEYSVTLSQNGQTFELN